MISLKKIPPVLLLSFSLILPLPLGAMESVVMKGREDDERKINEKPLTTAGQSQYQRELAAKNEALNRPCDRGNSFEALEDPPEDQTTKSTMDTIGKIPTESTSNAPGVTSSLNQDADQKGDLAGTPVAEANRRRGGRPKRFSRVEERASFVSAAAPRNDERNEEGRMVSRAVPGEALPEEPPGVPRRKGPLEGIPEEVIQKWLRRNPEERQTYFDTYIASRGGCWSCI